MKTCLAFAAVLLCVCGAPSHGVGNLRDSTEQKAVYFVLPPTIRSQQHISPEQVEDVMSQLRQEDGSDSGSYHIVLPDGRLQRVEYTTAPLKEENPVELQFVQRSSGPAALTAITDRSPSPSLAAQTQYPPGPAALISQNPRPLAVREISENLRVVPNERLFLFSPSAPQTAEVAQLNEDGPATPAKYVASVQYTDVQPITGPIYSYNSQPLTPIVRYASLY